MFYSIEITIEPQIVVSAPQSNTLSVTGGIVTKVHVRWRYGSGGLCGVRIFHHETQVWPKTLDQWIPSSVHPLLITARHPLKEPPFQLKIVTYNLDDIYDHKVWLGFDIDRPRELGILQRLIEFAQFGE